MEADQHPMSHHPLRYPTLEPQVKYPSVERLRSFARLLDRAFVIPGTQVGIGLDPVIGLMTAFVPGVGDFVGLMLSSYIVLEAARLGVPRATLGRMVSNILIDSVVGAIPWIGDIFDFAWTANIKNMQLLEDHLKFPSQRQKADKLFIIGILSVLLLVAIAVVAMSVILVRAVLSLFSM